MHILKPILKLFLFVGSVCIILHYVVPLKKISQTEKSANVLLDQTTVSDAGVSTSRQIKASQTNETKSRQIKASTIVFIKGVVQTYGKTNRTLFKTFALINVTYYGGLYQTADPEILKKKMQFYIRSTGIVGEVHGQIIGATPSLRVTESKQTWNGGCPIQPVILQFPIDQGSLLDKDMLKDVSIRTIIINGNSSTSKVAKLAEAEIEHFAGLEPDELGPEGQMGVCVIMSIYLYDDWRNLIRILELWRAQGFAHVHIPVSSYTPSVGQVLDAYRNEGFVTTVDWGSKFHPSESIEDQIHFMLHSDGLSQIARLTYCSWAMQAKVRYLAFLDLDETVSPNNLQDYSNVTQSHHLPLYNYFEHVRTTHQHIAAFGYMRPTTQVKWSSDAKDGLARIGETVKLENWNEIHIGRDATAVASFRKYVTIAHRCVSLDTHTVTQTAHFYKYYNLEDGLILHFRQNINFTKFAPGYKVTDFQKTDRMQIFTKKFLNSTSSLIPEQLWNLELSLAKLSLKDLEECHVKSQKMFLCYPHACEEIFLNKTAKNVPWTVKESPIIAIL